MMTTGRITLRGYSLVGLLAGAFLGCGSDESVDPGATAPEPGVGEQSAALYERNNIQLFTQNGNVAHICFLTSGFATQKREIQDAINNTWARYSALTFEGFEDCPATIPDRWIPWRLAQGGGTGSWGGNTAIGMTGRLGDGNPSAQVTQTIASDDSMTRTVAVHEVGHAIGWVHEHQRPNRPSITTCLARLGVNPNDGNVTIDANGTYLTAYDPDSIMNYCRDRDRDGQPDLFDEPSLTASDIYGLQKAYGRKHAGVLVGMNNECVDIPNGTNPPLGLNLQVYNCYGTTNQLWSYATFNSRLVATRVASGVAYMDIEGGSSASGTPVQVYTLNSGANQKWSFSGVQIMGIGDLCLERPAGQNFPQLATCNGAANQRWDLLPQIGAHTIRIRATGSSSCLVAASNASSGTLVRLSGCTISGTDTEQVFSFTALGEIQARSFCLDTLFADLVPGRPLVVADCRGPGTGKLSQQFTIAGPVTSGLGTCLTAGSSNFSLQDPLQSASCAGAGTAPFTWEYYLAP